MANVEGRLPATLHPSSLVGYALLLPRDARERVAGKCRKITASASSPGDYSRHTGGEKIKGETTTKNRAYSGNRG